MTFVAVENTRATHQLLCLARKSVSSSSNEGDCQHKSIEGGGEEDVVASDAIHSAQP